MHQRAALSWQAAGPVSDSCHRKSFPVCQSNLKMTVYVHLYHQEQLQLLPSVMIIQSSSKISLIMLELETFARSSIHHY